MAPKLRWLWVRDMGPGHPNTEWVTSPDYYHGDDKDPDFPVILKTERLIAYGVRSRGRTIEVRFLIREDLLDVK